MAIYRIRDLGGTGVITDLAGYNVPSNGFTKANNARFFNNRIEKIGGNQKIFSKNMPSKPVLAICQRPNTQQIIYGTPDSIYIGDGSSHSNASVQTSDTFPQPKAGSNSYGKSLISDLTNVIQISLGHWHTLCLIGDGTVVARGDSAYAKTNVGTWSSVDKVVATAYDSFGIKADGTIVHCGRNASNLGTLATAWTEIVDLASDNDTDTIIGAKSDGTVIGIGDNTYGQRGVSGWSTIKKVSMGLNHTVGLKQDGTVVATGNNFHGQCNVTGWTDVIQISANGNFTLGLKSNGTVLFCGDNGDGQGNVSGWSDVRYISAGRLHSIGVLNDNTAVACGSNAASQLDGIGTFGNIHLLEAGYNNTLGLKYSYNYTPYLVNAKNTWHYDYLSNCVIFNSLNHNPQGLLPNEINFVELPGWGKSNKDSSTVYDWKTPVIRSFKNYLLALSTIEDGIDYPQRVRWSDVSYVNALPTNWHQDDPNTDGGFNDLSSSTGKIVDGCTLSDKFILYTDKETYIMSYIGGDFIFEFTKLFSDSGLLAPECVCEFEGKHFVISENDIFIHNGSSKEPVASGRVKDFLLTEISSSNSQATKVFAYPKRKEIWIQYISSGIADSEDVDDPFGFACNRAAIWNYEYNTWYFTELSNSFDLNIVYQPNPDIRAWEDYGTIGIDEWDAIFRENEAWNAYKQSFNNQIIVSGSKDYAIYGLDVGSTFTYKQSGAVLSRPVVTTLEKSNIDFDDVVEDIGRHKFITSMYPQISGTGNLTFYIGGSNNPNSDPVWDMNTTYTINEDIKVDCFSNYRYPALKIVDSTEGRWTFSSLDIQFVIEGTR